MRKLNTKHSQFSILHSQFLWFAPQLPGPFGGCVRAGFTPSCRLSVRRLARLLFPIVVVGSAIAPSIAAAPQLVNPTFGRARTTWYNAPKAALLAAAVAFTAYSAANASQNHLNRCSIFCAARKIGAPKIRKYLAAAGAKRREQK
jgi:hypothetical protein